MFFWAVEGNKENRMALNLHTISKNRLESRSGDLDVSSMKVCDRLFLLQI